MTILPISTEDLTLLAVDQAAEDRQSTYRRGYLGMSALGNECSRELWYSFRWVSRPKFKAKTLRLFEDGHRTEDLMADRIRAVPGVTLHSLDPATGRQIGWDDFGGHLKGHCDGIVVGLKQAPATMHLWENKATNPKKFEKLVKLRAANEKAALAIWDQTYHAQQILYMDYGELDRSWMTVTTPGGREMTAVRTEADPKEAKRLRDKAERIIFSDDAPDRIREKGKDTAPPCVWCDHRAICHNDAPVTERNCRTCVHVDVKPEGGWHCTMYQRDLDHNDQEAGCSSQRLNPSLVAGKATDANREENWIEYEMNDGTAWADTGREQ